EYNHVLQFGYDFAQDTWMFEATAVWMEDRVYNDVNDYLQYMAPWAQLSFLPITQFDANDQTDPYNIKVYGDSVLNRWIDSPYGLVNVAPTNAPRIRLVFHTARGPQMAVALVCRVGDESGGTSTASVAQLPHGGLATLALDNPGRCARITAVLINADGRTTG